MSGTSQQISKKIAHLVRNEGKKPKQAVAIAHSMAKKNPAGSAAAAAMSGSKKY